MTGTLPTRAAYVLLCEGIRQEVGGKVTLLGVFAGNRLEIPRDVAFPATLVLGFFAVFLDGEGEYEGTGIELSTHRAMRWVQSLVLARFRNIRTEP